MSCIEINFMVFLGLCNYAKLLGRVGVKKKSRSEVKLNKWKVMMEKRAYSEKFK
jgi:hypothetical protein